MPKLFGIIRQGAEYNGLIRDAGLWGEFVRTTRYSIRCAQDGGTTLGVVGVLSKFLIWVTTPREKPSKSLILVTANRSPRLVVGFSVQRRYGIHCAQDVILCKQR